MDPSCHRWSGNQEDPELETLVAAATATPAGATGAESITTIGSTAAVFPAAGARTALSAASAIPTSTGVATSSTGVTTTATCVSAATTAVTTARATTAAAATTAITTAAATAGLGLVDAQGSTHQLSALQPLDSAGLGLIVGHLHEGEAALPARIPFQGQGTVHDLAKRSKQFTHVFLFGPEGEVADKNAHDAKYRTPQALTPPA